MATSRCHQTWSRLTCPSDPAARGPRGQHDAQEEGSASCTSQTANQIETVANSLFKLLATSPSLATPTTPPSSPSPPVPDNPSNPAHLHHPHPTTIRAATTQIARITRTTGFVWPHGFTTASPTRIPGTTTTHTAIRRTHRRKLRPQLAHLPPNPHARAHLSAPGRSSRSTPSCRQGGRLGSHQATHADGRRPMHRDARPATRTLEPGAACRRDAIRDDRRAGPRQSRHVRWQSGRPGRPTGPPKCTAPG